MSDVRRAMHQGSVELYGSRIRMERAIAALRKEWWPTVHVESAIEKLERIEQLNSVRQALRSGVLTSRERSVMESLYGLNGPTLSLLECGAKYKITRERVRQIQHMAIRKLQAALRHLA